MLRPFAHPIVVLLRVVGSDCSKFETGQTFSYVHANGRNNSQHCWANNVGNFLKEASHRSYRRNFCSCEMKA